MMPVISRIPYPPLGSLRGTLTASLFLFFNAMGFAQTDPDCGNHNPPTSHQLGTALPGANSSSGAPLVPGADYTIGGNFTVDNVYQFINADVVMEPSAVIRILGGAELEVTDGTRIFSCSDMWRSILVQGDGHLIVNDISYIEDGVVAVQLLNGSNGNTASLLTLQDAYFDKNRTHIRVHGYNQGVHPATISESVFNCTGYNSPGNTLKPPYSGQYTETGIHLTNVNQPGTITNGFEIGIPHGVHFRRMKYGIYADVSSFTVQQSEFEDIDRPSGGMTCPNPPCEGTAIFGKGGTYTRAKIGGPASSDGNEVDTSFIGVDLVNYGDVNIEQNLIEDDVPNPYLTGAIGVRIEQSFGEWDLEVIQNEIREHRKGIQLFITPPDKIPATFNIAENIVESPAGNFYVEGIRVEATDPLTISDGDIVGNKLYDLQAGIDATNLLENIDIEENYAELTAPAGPYGIGLEDCKFLILKNNNVIGNGIGPSISSVGIRAAKGHGNSFQCNRVEEVRWGLRLLQNIPYGTVVHANTFENFWRGLTLENSSELPDQGGTNNPSSNKFVGTPGNADTWADATSNLNGTVFWVDPSNPNVPTVNTGNSITTNNSTSGSFTNCPPWPNFLNAPKKDGAAKETGKEGAAEHAPLNCSFEWSPNPTRDRSVLRYELGGRTDATLTLTDVQGRTLKSRTLLKDQGRTELDLSAVEPGIYIYRVEKDGELLGSGRLVRTGR